MEGREDLAAAYWNCLRRRTAVLSLTFTQAHTHKLVFSALSLSLTHTRKAGQHLVSRPLVADVRTDFRVTSLTHTW